MEFPCNYRFVFEVSCCQKIELIVTFAKMHRSGNFFYISTWILFVLCLVSFESKSQGFVSYFTGDTSDIQTSTQPGFVLMGGSTENDEAMKWWLNKANGGDVLVIRASGSNGYNSYLFSELGITVNSVETLVFQNRQAGFSPYVKKRLAECEALWIAGGDQSVYANYWKNSPVDSLINFLINVKKIPVGGTSAGMAILGEAYFDAKNGSVTSSESLSNPFGSRVSIGRGDFLKIPLLEKTITDTHFDNPDRRGRLFTFLARLYSDSSQPYFGIASEEKTAVCVDNQGVARVFGNSPSTEFAYFIQVNCENDSLPENCNPNSQLTWKRNNAALKVCKIPGTNAGTNFFDLTDWFTESGGTWENWFANNGLFFSNASFPPNCVTSQFSHDEAVLIETYPNPVLDLIKVQSQEEIIEVRILDQMGRVIQINRPGQNLFEFSVHHLPKGFYFLEIRDIKERIYNKKFQKI